MEALQLVERSIERTLDSGLVAAEAGEDVGAVRILTEDVGVKVVAVDIYILFGKSFPGIQVAEIEPGGFHGPEALEAPGVHNDLVEQESFGGPDGLIFGFEGGEEIVELFFALAGENGVFGGEAVGEGVVADGGASFRRLRAGAFLGVAAVGVELLDRDHVSLGSGS